jgi:hypothetical protein
MHARATPLLRRAELQILASCAAGAYNEKLLKTSHAAVPIQVGRSVSAVAHCGRIGGPV